MLLILHRLTTREHPGQVLDAALSRVSSLPGAHQARHVTGKGLSLRPRFARRGEVSRARQPAVHLDEIGPCPQQRVDRAPRFVGSRDRHRAGPDRRRPVEDVPGGHDARPGKLAASDPPAARLDPVEPAEHLANPRYSVRQQQRKKLSIQTGEGCVDVHVPEAGNQILPACIDHPGPGGDPGLFRDRADATPAQDDGHSGEQLPAVHLDDGGVGKGDRRKDL